MNRSAKAVLLSLLVFPGVGQWSLGLWLRGALFLLPALAAAAYFFSGVWELAMAIDADIQAGRMGLDPVAIAQRVHAQSASSSSAMNWAALVMLVCWVGSVADAWLAGRKARPAP